MMINNDRNEIKFVYGGDEYVLIKQRNPYGCHNWNLFCSKWVEEYNDEEPIYGNIAVNRFLNRLIDDLYTEEEVDYSRIEDLQDILGHIGRDVEKTAAFYAARETGRVIKAQTARREALKAAISPASQLRVGRGRNAAILSSTSSNSSTPNWIYLDGLRWDPSTGEIIGE